MPLVPDVLSAIGNTPLVQRAGGTVVEYTSGTTGVSIALVCAAKGYGLEIVYSDAFTEEKRLTMHALGARLTMVPSDEKRINEALIRRMIETAREISTRPGVFWTDQLNSHDAIMGYHALGQELWTQTDGGIDAFVHAIGTAHSIHGAARALRTQKPALHAVAALRVAERLESAATVATIIVDSGLRYLSTDLYQA